MLTKDLLKYRLRKGVITPQFLACDDAPLHAFLRPLLRIAREASGKRLYELEGAWEDEGLSEHPYYAPFKKLLTDRMRFTEESSTKVEERRWQWLREAQTLRQEHLFSRAASFQEAFAQQAGVPFAELGEGLFADLPECRRIEACDDDLEASSLIGLYNRAQVQGLLLRARALDLQVKAISLKDKRDLLRAVKFHRLVAEVAEPKAKGAAEALLLRVSGPLAQIEQAQTYGMRLAQFFPRLFALGQWSFSAELSLPERGGNCLLKLAASDDYGPCPRAERSYIPEEFSSLVEAFAQQAPKGWKAAPGHDFVHLGRQSYCFPDLQFENKNGVKFYLELFHRWHFGQLKDRLETLKKNPSSSLILGVCRSVAKKSQIKGLLEQSSWFAEHGFLFSDFPSPRAILTVLSRRGAL